MKEKLLIKTANELQKVLGLEPELDVTLEPDELTAQVKEAATFLKADDEITDEIIQALRELFPDSSELDGKVVGVFETLGILDKEEPGGEQEPEDDDDLFGEVDNAETMKELKDIAKSNDEFKEIRGQLSGYKSADELRTVMLDVLDEEEEPETKPETIPKKTKEKEEKNKPVKKIVVPKGTGVIVTIIETLKNKGACKSGVSKDEILEVLKKKFPDRDEKSMKNTINVQVPTRINKERDFEVEKLKTGNFIVK